MLTCTWSDCTHAAVMQLIKDRRDTAVRVIWLALTEGAVGNFPMYTDLDIRTASQVARNRPRKSRKLPDWWVDRSAQHKHPGHHSDDCPTRIQMQKCKNTADKVVQPNAHDWETNPQDCRQATLHLLEVKYTYDMRVHDLDGKAIKQHEQLVATLRKKWGYVKVHPIIIGAAGVMRQATDDSLAELGIANEARGRLLKNLCLQSIRWTSKIVQLRRPYLVPDGRASAASQDPPEDPQPPAGKPPDQRGRQPKQRRRRRLRRHAKMSLHHHKYFRTAVKEGRLNKHFLPATR